MNPSPRLFAALVAAGLAVWVLISHTDVARAIVFLAVAAIVLAVGLVVP